MLQKNLTRFNREKCMLDFTLWKYQLSAAFLDYMIKKKEKWTFIFHYSLFHIKFSHV